jgi:hypothetical protein
MPTYQLTGDAAATIPAAALAVRVHLPGDSGIEPPGIVPMRDGRVVVTAEIRRPPGSGIPLIVDGLTAPLTLRLRAQGSASFPAGTIVDLSLTAEFTRSADPYLVRVAGIDLSGLPWYDVAELTPTSTTLSIVRLDGSDEPLHGIAKEAHDVARTLLRSDALDPESEVDLQVVVDGSASMLRWAANGLLGEVLQAIGGIDHVIGHDRVLDIRLTSERQWRRISADEASAVVDDILAGPRRTEVVHTWQASTERAATVVVTDMTPPGWDPGRRDCCVVLCPADAQQLLATGQRVVAVSPEWEGAERMMDEAGVAALVGGVLEAVLLGHGTKGGAS